MSSNRNTHINLTRANYEEYFLLYVDGELSPEAMDAVDAFAALHPDLREELDLLMDTRLDSTPVSFGDTSVLLADRMKTASLEEDLLHFIDGELEPSAALALQAQLGTDDALRAEYALLLSAKLDPSETILCPDKASLYQHEEKRRPFAWWRAAAAIILLGGSAALWISSRSGSDAGVAGGLAQTEVRTQTKATVLHTAPATNTIQAGPGSEMPAAPASKSGTEKASRINTDGAGAGNSDVAVQHGKKTTPVIPAAASNLSSSGSLIAQAPDPRDRVEAVQRSINADHNDVREGLSQNIAEALVTKAPTVAYNPTNTATATAATNAVLRDEKPQASFRGFLRKAARFVEKRTGIKATNDDDELVVGAVAINLK
jgi:hypothetical protein